MINRLLIFIMIALPSVTGAVEVPQSWRRTMSNEPSTNYFLAKVTSPLASKDAELLRTVLVSLIAIRGCGGVSVNDQMARAFLVANGYYAIKGKRWSDAEFLARDSLRGTTDREIAHLCAGLDYLFGPEGILAPNLLRFGPAELRHYDPNKPYITIPVLPHSKS